MASYGSEVSRSKAHRPAEIAVAIMGEAIGTRQPIILVWYFSM